MNPVPPYAGERVMRYTVIHHGETNDNAFTTYTRLLRQQGVDLGRSPRVPEPASRRRWLYVWDTEAKAQSFAKELKKRTRDPAWEVVPVNAPVSEGPLGPMLIQLARRGTEWIFALHTQGRAIIRSAFPNAFEVDAISLDAERCVEYLKTHGSLADLVWRIAPTLTGLSGEQLKSLGYVVIDDQSDDTVVFEPPAVTDHDGNGSSATFASRKDRSGGNCSQASR